MKTKSMIIFCEGCTFYTQAEAVLRDGDPHWSYVHVCECEHIIMESEWNEINPIIELNKLSADIDRLMNFDESAEIDRLQAGNARLLGDLETIAALLCRPNETIDWLHVIVTEAKKTLQAYYKDGTTTCLMD